MDNIGEIMIKTETQKIRDSIGLTDAEIFSLARRLNLPHDVDSAGALLMSYETWLFLATSLKSPV